MPMVGAGDTPVGRHMTAAIACFLLDVVIGAAGATWFWCSEIESDQARRKVAR